MSQSLFDAYGEMLATRRARCVGRLQRAYPGWCRSLVEDALQQATADLLEACARPDSALARAWEEAGAHGMERLLSTAAWRVLRGENRRASHRREHPAAWPAEPLDGDDPLAHLLASRTAARLPTLVAVAAQRHSRREAVPLAAALTERLQGGDTDVVVAARHGVDRSALCRARAWLLRNLAA